MQSDDERRVRVVCYQLRQMNLTESNYPVHDYELLAMRYAPIKFRVYLLGERTYALYTDHVSLRTIYKESAPVSTDGTLAFLLFRVQLRRALQTGKSNIIADALSRGPDYDPQSSLSRQIIDDDEDDDRCVYRCT